MRHVVVGRLLAPLLLVALLAAGPLRAQPAAEPTPDQVKSLLQLLADPVVKTWIAREIHSPAAGAGTPAPAPRESVETEVATFFEAGLADLRERVHALAAAVPDLPGELLAAEARLFADLESTGWLRVLLLLAAFVGFGYGCERVLRLATAAFRERLMASPLDTPAARGRAALVRLLYGLAMVMTFAAGSIGAFLAFSWPVSLRAVVLGYLLAFLALRVAMIVARFLFAPQKPRFRLVPMADVAGSLWYRSVVAFVGWYAFGYVTIQLLRRFDVGEPAALIIAYLLGLGLLAIVLRLIWRSDTTAAGRVAATAAVALIYLTWVGGARPVMWALIVTLLLPVTLRAGKRSVEHLYRQEAEPAVDDAAATVPLPAGAVLLDRAVRFLLLLGGLWLLAWGWGIDYGVLTNQEDPVARFARGALHAVVILLVADLLWRLASTAIDRRIAHSGTADAHDPETASDLPPEEERRRARLRTLLPILRIALFAVLAVMAVLMALSALGVEIGPLIAGAGVIGVAIGFGSQTLVRDIISGMFYLLDDAFRVGEYIVSGNFRGTVEGFSLRSIRLRHHRGPLFTVPFGNLGAVQNLSRDWVIDKITFNVPFATDVAKVKKIVKRVSAEIMQEPALAKGILEPLKSQGVFAMNDFAMQIRVKFKAKPGGQFAVRRAAYDLIKRALAENGIKIAVPTVNVAGGESDAHTAAAQQAVAMAQVPPAA